MKTKKTRILIIILSIFIQFNFFSQSELPFGYRNIKLGMTVEEVKAALKKDIQFGYRGDRDVSMLPGQDRILIETDTSKTAPFSFIERAWFQFHEEKLYIVTVNLKQSKMDHYSVFSTLMNKYGKPDYLNPEKSEWNDDKIIMTLERPLTLKYVDKIVFEKIQSESMVKKSAEEESRQEFLNSL